tara:strand:+ start:75 stop:488 length:414 start_codon:yes stop_codon:yes gene_type:complete
MAFKMKGNPYKMGSMATKSAMKAKGEPKNSENATTNLLQNLDNFGTKKETERIVGNRTVGEYGAYTGHKNKGADYTSEKVVSADAKIRAGKAKSARKRGENKAKTEALRAETARRNELGAKGRKKEDKAAKRAAKKA